MLELHLFILDDQRSLREKQLRCEQQLVMPFDVEIFAQLICLAPQDRVGITDLPERPTIRRYPVPLGLKLIFSSEDNGFVARSNDDRGNALTYTYAGDLARLTKPEHATERNKAVFAYVKALPPKTPIVLWWR